MKVKVRHENDAEGTYLGDIDMDSQSIKDVIGLLQVWGVYIASIEDEVSGLDADFNGQFIIGPTEAYFEITVSDVQ